MNFKVNGSRIREARRYRQLTITELARQLAISKQMISKYERGNAQPSLEIFHKIVNVLKFPADFFTDINKFTYSDEGTFFRSRLTATQVEKNPSETFKEATGLIRDLFEQYIEFPKLFKNNINAIAPKDAAVELRKLWELGDKPIKSMMDVLEQHGIVVALSNSESSKIDAHGGFVSFNGHRYYLIFTESEGGSFYRQQFSLAHELGHFILHAGVFNPQSLDPDDYRQMEKEADEFASNFLLPAEAFIKSLGNEKMNLKYYLQLKNKWYVAASAMVYRARNLGILTSEDYVLLQKRISYHKWRKVEPLDKETPISRPKLLRQSLELLENADIIKANEIGNKLGKNYGVVFPNEIISQVIDVPINKFKADIVHLKPNTNE